MDRNKKPEECRNIEEIRKEIDLLDRKIIELFSERDNYVKRIVQFKKDEDEVIAFERKEFVINERTQLAAESGLDAVLFKKLFTLLVEHNIKKELEILQQEKLNHKNV